MDNWMTNITYDVQHQMDAMNLSLFNLQKTLLHMVGVPDPGLIFQQCAMARTQTDNIVYGSQPVLPGGLGELWVPQAMVGNKKVRIVAMSE